MPTGAIWPSGRIPGRRSQRSGCCALTASRCGASPSGHWRLRACSPFVLTGCASPAARSPQDTIAAAKPSQAAKPGFAEGGPDAEDYGASQGYPIGDRATFNRIPFLVGSHSHLDQIFEGRLVRRSTTPSPLARAASEPAVRYEYQGQTFTLNDYLARNPATGLLVARGDTIFIERYQYGRNDRQRITSWSMAKTVTSMLVGIAIAEGHIHSVDDPAAAYVPALADTEYGRTSLRHLLQMSSGVRFIEEYSGRDLTLTLEPVRLTRIRRANHRGDITRLFNETVRQAGSGGISAVTPYNVRVAPAAPGSITHRSKPKCSVSSYEARWVTRLPSTCRRRSGSRWGLKLTDLAHRPRGPGGNVLLINAVLRDYARLGLLLAHDGHWRGRQIIPAAWIEDATRVRPGQPQPGTGGYGYQVWILSGERRKFALRGVRGQSINIDPTSRLVMVHTAVRKQARDPGVAEASALWRGLVQELGD